MFLVLVHSFSKTPEEILCPPPHPMQEQGYLHGTGKVFRSLFLKTPKRPSLPGLQMSLKMSSFSSVSHGLTD